MSQHLQLHSRSLHLSRYPQQHSQDLRAWNAADELLLDYASQQNQAVNNILIINDEFGALACGVLAMPQLSHCQITWLSDSFVAQQALQQNLAANQLESKRLNIISSTAKLPAAELILMRLAKSLNYLEYQLISLQSIMQEHSQLACGAMLKSLPKSVFSLFEQHIGSVTTSLAKKKARLLFGHYQQKHSQQPYPKSWQLAEYQWQLKDHANVFCFGKFDIGTRFMLQHLPNLPVNTVIDLGCGNGLLGLRALELYPDAHIHFCDESNMAITSAQNNVSLNHPEDLARCSFSQDNALQHQASDSADLILCNPPFHQQNTISSHIAQQMFDDAKRCLRSGGQLLLVANRHLGYHPLLKSLFGGYKLLASNNKFVILSSTKR